jgi:hypothetical protein
VRIMINPALGSNTQNFVRKIIKIFVTFRCFYEAIFRKIKVFKDFYGSCHQSLGISAQNIFLFIKISDFKAQTHENLMNLP